MRAALSKRQKEVYDYLRLRPEATIEDMAIHLGISRPSAYDLLQMVTLKGWAEHFPNRRPAYRALPPYECCPHCGHALE